MGVPPRPVPGSQRRPGAPPPPPAVPKAAVLEVTRSDNGDATYRLLIDGVAQPLKGSVAKWDDASPWEAGNYGAEYSPLRGKYDAFLLKYPPNRSSIKFHLGTETGHSEGCIVTRSANITEIEQVLADNGIARDDLRFDVIGDFPVGFRLSVKDGVTEVARGGTLVLRVELTGGGAPGGVSKDIWFHIVADGLEARDYALVHPEKVPPYVSRSSYPNSKAGVLVRLPTGEQQHDYEVRLVPPHAAPAHPAAGHRPAPAAPPSPAPDVAATFRIDNYKILNKAPGPAPYFYTPSDYGMVLAQGTRTDPVTVKPAAPATPAGAGGAVPPAPRPAPPSP